MVRNRVSHPQPTVSSPLCHLLVNDWHGLLVYPFHTGYYWSGEMTWWIQDMRDGGKAVDKVMRTQMKKE